MAPALLLSAAHRSAQNKLRLALAVSLVRAYRISIAPSSGDEMAARWIAAMLPSITAYRDRSVGLAATFYDRSRYLAYPKEGAFRGAVDLTPFPDEAIATSLAVTGIVGLARKLSDGMDPELAMTQASNAAAGAAGKIALNGGREFIKQASAADRLSLGYFRETRPGACSFCAMLASRGAVFKGDSFDASDPRFLEDPNSPSDVKVHDHCACGMVPVFSRSSELPDLNRQFKELWLASTDGYSGNDALNAFRRAYRVAYPESQD